MGVIDMACGLRCQHVLPDNTAALLQEVSHSPVLVVLGQHLLDLGADRAYDVGLAHASTAGRWRQVDSSELLSRRVCRRACIQQLHVCAHLA